MVFVKLYTLQKIEEEKSEKLYMAFQIALESNKNMSNAINMTLVEQLAIAFTRFLYCSWDLCVCREETRKLSFVLVIFVVASSAKEKSNQ